MWSYQRIIRVDIVKPVDDYQHYEMLRKGLKKSANVMVVRHWPANEGQNLELRTGNYELWHDKRCKKEVWAFILHVLTVCIRNDFLYAELNIDKKIGISIRLDHVFRYTIYTNAKLKFISYI